MTERTSELRVSSEGTAAIAKADKLRPLVEFSEASATLASYAWLKTKETAAKIPGISHYVKRLERRHNETAEERKARKDSATTRRMMRASSVALMSLFGAGEGAVLSKTGLFEAGEGARVGAFVGAGVGLGIAEYARRRAKKTEHQST